jgi:hypothetical protein
MHKRSSPIAEDDGRAVGRQRLLGSDGEVVVVVVKGSEQRCSAGSRQQAAGRTDASLAGG